MSVAEAKRLALLEAQARAMGIQPWQLEMALAVPDGVVRDIVRDFRRGVSAPSSPGRPSDKPAEQRVTMSQRGWADPRPLESPPGIKWIDGMMKVQEDIDRAEWVRKLAEVYQEKK